MTVELRERADPCSLELIRTIPAELREPAELHLEAAPHHKASEHGHLLRTKENNGCRHVEADICR